MSWPIQDHADAVLAQLQADAGLTVYDGKVTGAADHYVLVYMLARTPNGLQAPEMVPFSGDSDVLDLWIFCHCVGLTAAAARAISGRVRNQLLNFRPVISGRACVPIRWRDGQTPQRDEETLRSVFDLVDVYGLTSVPG